MAKAIGTYDKATWTLRDISKETTTHELYLLDIDDESLPDILTAQTAYQTALVGITNGVLASHNLTINYVVSNLFPSDPSAHRENKLQVFYRSVTTEQIWELTIGTVDFTKLTFLPNAGDFVAMTAGQGASAEIQAFITAFQAFAKSADGLNSNVVITGLKYVGRNT